MKLQKDFMTRFIIYPIVFLIGVTILCLLQSNWEDFDMTIKIILAYYILMSFWFYFDLRKNRTTK